MGFCTKKQRDRFLELCPQFEQWMIESGILLLKFWLEVSDKEQARRFEARITDPLRQWKLSPMDLPSRERWIPTTRGPETRCWRRRTPSTRPGTSCPPTTSGRPG